MTRRLVSSTISTCECPASHHLPRLAPLFSLKPAPSFASRRQERIAIEIEGQYHEALGTLLQKPQQPLTFFPASAAFAGGLQQQQQQASPVWQAPQQASPFGFPQPPSPAHTLVPLSPHMAQGNVQLHASSAAAAPAPCKRSATDAEMAPSSSKRARGAATRMQEDGWW